MIKPIIGTDPKVSARACTRVFQRDGESITFGMNLTRLVVPAQAGTQAVPHRAPWAWGGTVVSAQTRCTLWMPLDSRLRGMTGWGAAGGVLMTR
ncbi:hypothetical protein BXU06_05375 [Aquaspirillum sp. LM1]|nr:hypothetical protein BXU06_05375 [Aquaspirillum sp. LM1]